MEEPDSTPVRIENPERWNGMILRLKHSLQALAMPAEVQLELFPDFVSKVEELALDFDHWSRCVLNNDESTLSEEQRSILEKLDSIFDEMSGEKQQHLWTEDALKNDLEWQRVRNTAKVALSCFGWNEERPPSHQHEFVSGAA